MVQRGGVLFPRTVDQIGMLWVDIGTKLVGCDVDGGGGGRGDLRKLEEQHLLLHQVGAVVLALGRWRRRPQV